MEVPPGYGSKEGMVCKLKKALHGRNNHREPGSEDFHQADNYLRV